MFNECFIVMFIECSVSVTNQMAHFFMQTDNLNFTVLCICCAPLCVILQDMLGSLQLRLQVLETAITVHENLQMVWSCFNLKTNKTTTFIQFRPF